jgi:hypothetical protein
MIVGAHSIIYSKNAEADRAFLRDVLKLSHVDVGGGWLIFGLPPAEVAVHPGEENGVHEFYLMCEDVEALVDAMAAKDIVCGPIQEMAWGAMTELTLPGGGTIGIYEPRHVRPNAHAAPKAARKKPAARKVNAPAKRLAKAAKSRAKAKTTKPKRRRG